MSWAESYHALMFGPYPFDRGLGLSGLLQLGSEAELPSFVEGTIDLLQATADRGAEDQIERELRKVLTRTPWRSLRARETSAARDAACALQSVGVASIGAVACTLDQHAEALPFCLEVHVFRIGERAPAPTRGLGGLIFPVVPRFWLWTDRDAFSPAFRAVCRGSGRESHAYFGVVRCIDERGHHPLDLQIGRLQREVHAVRSFALPVALAAAAVFRGMTLDPSRVFATGEVFDNSLVAAQVRQKSTVLLRFPGAELIYPNTPKAREEVADALDDVDRTHAAADLAEAVQILLRVIGPGITSSGRAHDSGASATARAGNTTLRLIVAGVISLSVGIFLSFSATNPPLPAIDGGPVPGPIFVGSGAAYSEPAADAALVDAHRPSRTRTEAESAVLEIANSSAVEILSVSPYLVDASGDDTKIEPRNVLPGASAVLELPAGHIRLKLDWKGCSAWTEFHLRVGTRTSTTPSPGVCGR